MALGIIQDGGMVEQFRVPSHKLFALPDRPPIASASLVEPASVAWHGVRLGGTSPESRVAVVGAGSIGQLAAAGRPGPRCERSRTGGPLPLPTRGPRRLGVGEPAGLYDIVIEAAGSSTAMQRCVDLARPGGTIVILGVIYGTLDVPFRPLFTRELRLVASMSYCGHAGQRE